MIEFPIIDAHIHLLDQRRFTYSWAASEPRLRHDFAPDDLARAARPYVVEGFIFVEVDVDRPQHLDRGGVGRRPR